MYAIHRVRPRALFQPYILYYTYTSPHNPHLLPRVSTRHQHLRGLFCGDRSEVYWLSTPFYSYFLSSRATLRGRRKYFAGVEEVARVEDVLDVEHGGEFGFVEHERHEGTFLNADAVFAA